MIKKWLLIGTMFLVCLSNSVAILAASQTKASMPETAISQKTYVYKTVGTRELQLYCHFPPGWNAADRRPAMIFFFGGGWTRGTVQAFLPQAEYFAGRGLVTVRADYRVKDRDNVTPEQCVEDARSAVRWLRQNASKLGVDPQCIITSGGSAGGHLAACAMLQTGVDAAEDDRTISTVPRAMVLFNPVLNMTGDRHLARLNGDLELARKISPVLHLDKNTPPAIIFFGTEDRLKVQGDDYWQRAQNLGLRADQVIAPGQKHGFFNHSPWLEKTIIAADRFLASLGFISGEPAITTPGDGSSKSEFSHFVTRSGDKLMDGAKEYRFISFNVPNLHYIEDNMKFEEPIACRLPDAFEIMDALQSVKQMGGQVARVYALTVRRADDPPGLPRHVLGPGNFSEPAFVALDKMLELANQVGVRVTIAFVDNWKWLGGVPQYAEFRGKATDDFWTDAQLVDDFKETIRYVINRANTFTGIQYKDDRAIMAWETGNELHAPQAWTNDITAYIKSLDANHLVIDGYHTRVLKEESIDNFNVDLVQTHHYEKDPVAMIANIKESQKKAKGKKPYYLGEFGFISTEAIRAVLATIIEEGLAGGKIWSLRFHNRDGGFYWHHEPYGGDFFKAYHYPGFISGEHYDEINLIKLMREQAFAIRNLPVPETEKPEAPLLLPIDNVAAISWQGSVGASCYDVERSESKDGPWSRVGIEISDAQVQYRPLFCDQTVQPGIACFYRVIAKNLAGISPPSNVVGPVRVTHLTLVDELWNDSKIFYHHGPVFFEQNKARMFKEDCHRLRGEVGSHIVYYVAQPMWSWQIYGFAPKNSDDFIFLTSTDGRNYFKVQAQKEIFSDARGDYDYWLPVLYSMNQGIAAATKYLKIEFHSEAQLARVEINYGRK